MVQTLLVCLGSLQRSRRATYCDPVVSIFKATVLFRERIITMLDERVTRLRAHRDNIARYRGLLKTDLTDHERQFIERRLSEEQSEFELLGADIFPLTLEIPS